MAKTNANWMHSPTPLYARRPIFVWDTETTGLSPVTESFVEIAVAELPITANRTGLLSFSSLIHPRGVECPRSSQRVHGITNQMLQDAPHFRAVWKGVEEYIKHASQGRGRPILVAHNLPFDLRFLKEELRRIDVQIPPWDFADSLRDVAHVVWPGESGSLQALVDRLGIVNEEAHRALSDVEATSSVLQEADRVLAERAAAKNPKMVAGTRPGDFIYEVIASAAERHRVSIRHLWRDEAQYAEGSIADSATLSSSSQQREPFPDLCGSSLSDSSSEAEDRRAKSKSGLLFELPTGAVYHHSANCTALMFCQDVTAVTHSSRKPCRICVPKPVTIRKQGNNTTLPENSSISQRIRVTPRTQLVLGKPSTSQSSATSQRENHSGQLYFFTPAGTCFHMQMDCYGLRKAFNIRSTSKARADQRPCQLCCSSENE